MNNKLQRGFSLIELMIVVAVITILASIAFPSYQDHVRKARRSAAQQYLLDISLKQEQYMLNNRMYTDDVADLNMTSPDAIDGFYTVTIAHDGGDTSTYTITATPTTANAGAATLTYNNLGVKEPASEWK